MRPPHTKAEGMVGCRALNPTTARVSGVPRELQHHACQWARTRCRSLTDPSRGQAGQRGNAAGEVACQVKNWAVRDCVCGLKDHVAWQLNSLGGGNSLLRGGLRACNSPALSRLLQDCKQLMHLRSCQAQGILWDDGIAKWYAKSGQHQEWPLLAQLSV